MYRAYRFCAPRLTCIDQVHIGRRQHLHQPDPIEEEEDQRWSHPSLAEKGSSHISPPSMCARDLRTHPVWINHPAIIRLAGMTNNAPRRVEYSRSSGRRNPRFSSHFLTVRSAWIPDTREPTRLPIPGAR